MISAYYAHRAEQAVIVTKECAFHERAPLDGSEEELSDDMLAWLILDTEAHDEHC